MADNTQQFSIEDMQAGLNYIVKNKPSFIANSKQFRQTTDTLKMTWHSPAATAYYEAADGFYTQLTRTEQDLTDIENALRATLGQFSSNVESTNQHANRINSFLNG